MYLEGTARLERASNWVAASRVIHLRQVPRWSRVRNLNPLLESHNLLCQPVKLTPGYIKFDLIPQPITRFLEALSSLQDIQQLTTEVKLLVRTTGLEPARAYAQQPLKLSCLPISPRPHMYSRFVICLAGLRHPIRLVAQDIAFMVGDEGIAPTRTRRFWFYRPAPLL